MQWSNLFCPCEQSEIGEVPQGEGVEKDRKDAVSLSVPATSRERRDSTNGRIADCANVLLNIDVNSVSRIAYGTNTLLNVGVNVINSLVDFFNPSVSHSSPAPLYCFATQRSKRLPILLT